MKKQEAIKIIKDVFESRFDKKKFTYFISNLLKKLEPKPFGNGGAYTGNTIPKAFRQTIRKMERIGKFIDEQENVIDVLVVELQRGHSIEHARTTQRNFIRWYLNGSRGGELKDAALVAFYNRDYPEWRFSFVKMQYSLEKGKDEFTPAKRYSFLVGEKGKSHTAQKQLLDLLANDTPPTLDDLEKAFNIESVSDEFFERYKNLVFNVKEKLDDILKTHPKIKEEFENKKIDALNFAKKLLGQIVFLYFLQRKGWLGLREGQKYGEGNRRFMRDLFNQAKQTNKNFFNDYLEYLFYDALSRKRTTDFYEKFGCRIPFLNGGLFDPIGFYNWEDPAYNIPLPDELFSDRKDEDDEGTGILDVFDLYNFTVKEDEPLEKEVAIDPEMLGKVFERMLEVKERKSKGAFYTPREIVHYMAQQSLLYHLTEELPEIPFEDLQAFIWYGEHAVENDAALHEGRLKEGRHKYTLPESIRRHAAQIDRKLQEIKVVDPAVGSGAFPVGVMNEIVKMRQVLTHFMDDETRHRTPYHFKAHAIEHSLYGVDIDAGAVEIAKLRLWLSLVVDESNIHQIEPLPNLEYKMVRGNSLIGFPENWNSPAANEIARLIDKYHHLTDKREKQEMKTLIDRKIAERMARSKEVFGYEIDFDFRLYFHEVFKQKGGFDIVIGNPPYVRADSGEDYLEFRQKLLETKQYKTLWEKWDLYVAFLEKGYKILRQGGVLSFIIPSAYLTAKYASKSRQFFAENARIDRIDFLMDLDVFDASVKNIIIQISKHDPSGHIPLRLKHQKIFGNIKELKTELQTKLKENIFNETLKKVISFPDTITWGEIFYVSVGMVLNAHEKKAKGLFKKNDLISNEKDTIYSKPYIEGKDIEPYHIKKIRYLEWNTKRCPKLIRRPTFEELYIFPKIVRGRMTGAVYDDQGLVSNDSTIISTFWYNLKNVSNKSISNSVSKDFHVRGPLEVMIKRNELEEKSGKFLLKYNLSILNSELAYWFFNQVRRSALGLYPDDIKKLPVKQLEKNKQKIFEKIVDYIIFLKQQNDPRSLFFEQLIDGLVYELYFSEEIRKAGCELMKYVKELPAMDKHADDETKQSLIEQVYNRLNDPEGPVRQNLACMDKVEEIRIIRESLVK